MSQDYVHACERAELLGLPVPSEEEWKETQRAQGEDQVNNEEDDPVIQNLETADEAAKRIGGGLDELNSILNVTQKKINRFKTVCGSLGTLLKVKVGTRNNMADHRAPEKNRNEMKEGQQESAGEDLEGSEGNEKKSPEAAENSNGEPNEPRQGDGHPVTPKKIDLNEKMGSHLGKLDSLITKAENAQYSMQHQSKQMRKFLK